MNGKFYECQKERKKETAPLRLQIQYATIFVISSHIVIAKLIHILNFLIVLFANITETIRQLYSDSALPHKMTSERTWDLGGHEIEKMSRDGDERAKGKER